SFHVSCARPPCLLSRKRLLSNRHPQFRAARARGVPYLFVTRLDRLLRLYFPDRRIAKRLFHPPVFERVKADGVHAPARTYDARKFPEESIERRQLVVDRNSQRLKRPCGGVDPMAF